MAADQAPEISRWVAANAAGLAPAVAARVQELFGRHRVDRAFLDFLASPAGSSVLAAWREEAAGPDEPAPADAAEAQGRPRGAGRQRVDRRVERPYFRHAEPPFRHPPSSAHAMDPARRSTTAPAALGAPERAAPRAAAAPPGPTASVSSTAARAAAAPPGPTAAACGTAAQAAATPPGPAAAACGTAAQAAAPASATARALLEALGAEATPRGRIQQANTDATAPKVPAQERLVGTLKSFSAETGYGFIRCGAVPGDVFVRQVDLPLDAAPPGPGRSLEFVLCRDQQGRPQAREVSWLQGAQTAPSSTSRRFYGQLKSIGDKYGFIECPEAFGEYGRDVYLARGSLPAGEEWRTLHHLSFEVVPNQRGEPQAKDVVLEAAPAHCPASADSSEPEVTARATRW